MVVMDCASTGQMPPRVTTKANRGYSTALASRGVIRIFAVDAGIALPDAASQPYLLLAA